LEDIPKCDERSDCYFDFTNLKLTYDTGRRAEQRAIETQQSQRTWLPQGDSIDAIGQAVAENTGSMGS